MKTYTRCPHCQMVTNIRYGLLGKPRTCETCRRVYVSVELEKEERTAAGASYAKQVPFHDQEDTYSIANVDLTMVRFIPATFTMGADDGFVNERPAHQVTLTQPFYMSTTLVTQRQYQTIMKDSPSYFEGEDHPVETVSWMQAMEFCRRLTEREIVARRLPEGAYFRLPSEAEWEFACARQADTSGNTPDTNVTTSQSTPLSDSLTDLAWYLDNSDGSTHPVKAKNPNCSGLYDMLGNVGEWCLDDYGAYPNENTEDPIGKADPGQKIRRGGSWASVPARCRSTERVGVPPDCRCALIGFRVVLSQSGECPYNQDFYLV